MSIIAAADQRIELTVRQASLELEGYADDATLGDLAGAIEQVRTHRHLVTSGCTGCGLCCWHLIPVLGFDLDPLARVTGLRVDELPGTVLDLPCAPSPVTRRDAIRDLVRQHGLGETVAAVLYEYNNAEPITLARGGNGACRLLKENLCSIYASRPFACRFYVCNMADNLSSLYEMIIRQGIWHAYYELGWISQNDIRHNPFMGHVSYEQVQIRELDVDLSEALAALFSYF